MMTDEAKIRQYVWCGYGLIGCAILCPVLAAFLPCNPQNQALSIWFSHSGAIVNIFAFGLQFAYESITEKIGHRPLAAKETIDLRRKYFSQWNRLKKLIPVLVVGGTFIWGFGDMLSEVWIRCTAVLFALYAAVTCFITVWKK